MLEAHLAHYTSVALELGNTEFSTPVLLVAIAGLVILTIVWLYLNRTGAQE